MKEFSKSRLHLQALQAKHRQNTRGRIWRSASNTQNTDGKRKDMDDRQVPGGPWGSSQTQKEDPLGLIRREVAVMKKLEYAIPSSSSMILLTTPVTQM
jgi:[calcium/calmodulin-dependent protein kinase] kinase